MQLTEQHIIKDTSFLEVCIKAKNLYKARLGLSVSKNEMKISDLVMSCVSQPKKLNILYNKIEILK